MRLECLALIAALHGLFHVSVAARILQPRFAPVYGVIRRDEPAELLSRLFRRQEACAEDGIRCQDGSCCPQGTTCGTDGTNTCHEAQPRVKCTETGQSLCYWGGRGGDKVYGCCNNGLLCAGQQDTGYCKEANQKITDFVTVTGAAPSPDISVITNVVTEGGETVIITIGADEASATPTESSSATDDSSDSTATASTGFSTDSASSPTGSNDALAAGGVSNRNGTDGEGSSEKKSDPPIGAIVGGVVGGVAAILLFAFGVLWMKRRDRKNAANPPVPPGPVGPASMAYAGGAAGGQSHHYGPPGYQQNGYNENGYKELDNTQSSAGAGVGAGGYGRNDVPTHVGSPPPGTTYSELDASSTSPGAVGGYPPPQSNQWRPH